MLQRAQNDLAALGVGEQETSCSPSARADAPMHALCRRAQAARRLHDRACMRPRLRAHAARGARHRGRGRPGGDRGLDAHEGRDGAEARSRTPSRRSTMVRLGKTFGNLMVDVAGLERQVARTRAPCRRDRDRCSGGPGRRGDQRGRRRHEGGDLRCSAGVDAQTARSRLTAAGGVIREAVADVVG